MPIKPTYKRWRFYNLICFVLVMDSSLWTHVTVSSLLWTHQLEIPYEQRCVIGYFLKNQLPNTLPNIFFLPNYITN